MKPNLYINFLRTVVYSVPQNLIVFYRKNRSRTLRTSFLLALNRFYPSFRTSSYCKNSTFSSKKVQILKPKQIFFSRILNKLNTLTFCNRNKSNPIIDFVSKKNIHRLLFSHFDRFFKPNCPRRKSNRKRKDDLSKKLNSS
ncbi:Uncharacterized protein GNX_0822 [Leptospira interrogans serovar Canicola]|nr:Uncharacterized protein GNX_0822 [Leptospira interrogans serovar Canicola]